MRVLGIARICTTLLVSGLVFASCSKDATHDRAAKTLGAKPQGNQTDQAVEQLGQFVQHQGEAMKLAANQDFAKAEEMYKLAVSVNRSWQDK